MDQIPDNPISLKPWFEYENAKSMVDLVLLVHLSIHPGCIPDTSKYPVCESVGHWKGPRANTKVTSAGTSRYLLYAIRNKFVTSWATNPSPLTIK